MPNYETGRVAYARPFHLYRNSTNLWTKFEIPFALSSVGRSQIVLDTSDNAYVVLPFGRIVTASKSSGWTDWTEVFTGSALGAFGEVTIDRSREASGIASFMFQKNSTGTTPSSVQLVHFNLLD